jgi:hypothetical protein
MSVIVDHKLLDIYKKQIIDKLKYVFHDTNMDIMDQFNKLSKSYEQCKDDKDDKDDIILDEINEIRSNKLHTIFKKINILFTILNMLLKFKIVGVADERYQSAVDSPVVFPQTMDKLICVIGCYNEAFTQDIQESLFNIIDLQQFADLYSISKINYNMIPFVANDKINRVELNADYDQFSNKVKNIACEMLDINTDFEHDSIFELIDNE